MYSTAKEDAGRICTSYAKADPIYYDESTISNTLVSCTQSCIQTEQSCQFAIRSKTQRNNCRPSWCPDWFPEWPFCSPKCDVEEHCISNRPKGCSFGNFFGSYGLDCNIDDP